MKDTKRSKLEQAMLTKLDKRRSQSTIRQLTTNPSNSVDFSSNDFLSLASSQELRQIFLKELQHGSSSSILGSGGSRLLDGNSTQAEILERDIAAFHGAEAGLLCNSGFDANVGLFSCLPQDGDVVVYDEFIHASVHDGMRLSRAGKCLSFAHNDVDALKSTLESCLREDSAVRSGQRNVFIAVETVYSMDGDTAPLKDIVKVVKNIFRHGNGYLIVDEAHSTGIFGPNGRGLVCELGLENEFTIRLHTFGKALACNGAILLCSPTIRQYLINYARPLIYTTFMSHPALAAVKASYSLLVQGKTEPLADRLDTLIQRLHSRLLELQASLKLTEKTSHFLRVPESCPQSPIFSILSSEPKALAAYGQSHGFVIRGIVPPTVPLGTERIRVCLHSGNTTEQIDALVEIIRSWVVKRVRETEGEARARL